VEDEPRSIQQGLLLHATGEFGINADETGVTLRGNASDVRINRKQQLPDEIPVIASMPSLLVYTAVTTVLVTVLGALLGVFLERIGIRRSSGD